jgi:group I intron endonuclease
MVIYQALFPNGKKYIGKSKNFESRKYHHLRDAKRGSDLIFHRAIKKYGSENIIWEIICECLDENDMTEKEIFYIKEFNTIDPDFGYNMICGDEKEDYILRKNFGQEHQLDIIKRKLKGNGHDPEKYVVITEELSEEIRKDYIDNKFSIKALHRKYGISKNRITRFLKSESIEIDKDRCVLTNSINLSEKQTKKVIELFKSGKLIKEISEQENLTILIVSRILHDNGIRESKRFKNGKRYDGKQPKNRKLDNQN